MTISNKLAILLKSFYLKILYFCVNTCIPISEWRAKIYNYCHPDFFLSDGVKLRQNITFYAGSRLEGRLYIGANSFINNECFIDYSSNVTIGQNVALSMKCIILSSSHKVGYPMRCGELLRKITTIEDDCWIGAGVIIFPGITIGKGCVISAGEVVRKDIPMNMLLKAGKLSVLK